MHQFMITLWDRSNLYFRFPKVFSHIHCSIHTHPPKYVATDNRGTPWKMSRNHVLTENKKHEESLVGSIKRTQVVYMALFSCQERRLWKWHDFHRKLWDSRACLAPRGHTEILGVVHQPRKNYLPNHSFRDINWFPSLFELLFQVWRT